MDERVQINVRVEPGTHRAFKAMCAQMGRTMVQVLLVLIEAFLSGSLSHLFDGEEALDANR